jgi:mgtE-like transporter
MAQARRTSQPRRALARRARRLGGQWRAERRTVRQGFVALTLSTIAGFAAGLTLAHITGTLDRLPGLLVLIPAAVGMKGTIFGAIGARLGTASAAGILDIHLQRGGVLRRNVDVAILTTLSSSLWLAVLARTVSPVLGEASISVLDLVVISVVGGVLGSAVILAITIGLSAVSYRKGWDLDSVATPMVTALGDMATLPSLFLATFLLDIDVVTDALGVLCVAAGVWAAVRAYLSSDPHVRRIARQMTATILLTPVLDVLAGGLLQARSEDLTAVPVLYALIPPFVSQAGALGGIFASRTTSKLQLGMITPRGRPETPAVVDASIVLALAVTVFTMIGVLAWGLGNLTGLASMPSLTTLAGATFVAGIVAAPVTIVGGYYIAISTYRFGLDPDDQSVPIITSTMDLSGVAIVLAVMTLSGVLPHG